MPQPKLISEEKIMSATGKSWDEWFAIIDRANGTEMTHKQIVALATEHGASMWWQQQIAVSYAQHRGMRQVHEQKIGFDVSASKTINAPVEVVYDAVLNPEQRKEWLLDGDLEIRNHTPLKYIRSTWVDGETHVNANFYDKGAYKSQVVFQHTKLPNSKEAEKMKEFWRAQVINLKEYFEG